MSRIFNIKPIGLLHVGAHTAEEWPDYDRYGWGPIVWVEAQPDLAQKLRDTLPKSDNTILTGVVWSTPGISMELKIASSKGSTSLLDFKTHSDEHPDIKVDSTLKVTTTTLDILVPKDAEFDMLVIDIQGAELEALKGFENRLRSIKWIYSEVNRKELYKGCPDVQEVDEFLKKFGFKRTTTRWTIHGWGDAVYTNISLRKDSLNNKQLIELISLKLHWRYLYLRHQFARIWNKVKSSNPSFD